ncbi:MAG TPA: hypothetical protein VHO67_06160 [Polyangia bacterium]|nr:hypothetical protein [Polyangia bacterium]
MTSKTLDRKQFLTLTFTLLGGGLAAAACSSSGSSGGTGGTTGSTGATTGSGGTTGVACADPLPETQVADATGHTHTVTIPASDLNATADQMIDTSVAFGHMHSVTLTAANLAAIKAGGSVTVTSTSAGTPAHMHMYTVSCTA